MHLKKTKWASPTPQYNLQMQNIKNSCSSFMFRIRKLQRVFFAALVLSSLIPNAAGAATYTVAKGDSLYAIGELFGTSYSRIMSDNGLSGTTIYPGQKLDVPAGTYTVRSGDSLYLIAKAHQVSLYSLRMANNKWDDMIYAGQTLLIPAKNAGEATAGNFSSQSSAAKAVISYSNAELDLLARLITAEANNQPYQAKLGVGAVVVNRVQDSRFPNSISGVI